MSGRPNNNTFGRTVAAIGGNALSVQAGRQEEQLRTVVDAIKPVLDRAREVVLVHGNGPQVGVIHSAFEQDHRPMPFYDCTAMNEGAIGYHLEQALLSELSRSEGMPARTATVITRVVVDPLDEAFLKPDKPVGSFYSEEEAKLLMRRTGKTYGPDAGRGWRLMVPSPPPKRIVEADMIRQLAETGTVVLGGGGAGIPVKEESPGCYLPVEAVCDKDLISSMLAQLIDADFLLILTAVDNVAINFGKPDQKQIEIMTASQAKEYMKEGQFAPGSMLPKVKACVQFVESGPGRRAVIGNMTKAAQILDGTSGTLVVADGASEHEGGVL